MIYHCNKYSADSACEHCGGIIRHAHWCIELNSHVRYAYAVVANPDVFNEADRKFLKLFGLKWEGKICMGKLTNGGPSGCPAPTQLPLWSTPPA
jgi:hypothetical protein